LNKSYLLLPLALFVVSCASTTKVEETKIDYLDLSGKEQVELVKEYWSVAKRIDPRYPVSAARNNISGCVDLIVGIDQNGKAKGYKIRSSYPKGVFDNNAAAALVKWKWQATEKNKNNTPVLTSVRMDFSTSRNPTETKYLENCPKREV
jgi:TonB family protein